MGVMDLSTTTIALTLINAVAGEAEYCYDTREMDLIYCAWGCCGHTLDASCCLPVGVIIGAVIGVTLLLATVVAVIYCCWKSKGHMGTLVAPAAGPNMAVVQTIGYPAYGQMQPATAVYPLAPPPQGGAFASQHPPPGYYAGPGNSCEPTPLEPSLVNNG